MGKVIFTTTDGFPIYIGDLYHIVKEDRISHWVCDIDDPIPECATYKEYEAARYVKINGKYNADNIAEDKKRNASK